MADFQEQLGGILDNFFGGGVQITMFVVFGIFILALVVIIGYYQFIYKKKFDIIVKIISRRSGDDKVYFDTAAILHDKKNNKRYLKLWNTKTELEVPKFNIFYHTNKGDYVEIYRESEMGFRFLTPARIDKNFVVKSNGKKYPVTATKQFAVENDISWILDRMKTNKRLINPESFLMQILAYTPQIMALALTMVMFIILLRYAPQLMQSMTEFVEAVRQSSKPVEEVIGSLIGISLWKKRT